MFGAEILKQLILVVAPEAIKGLVKWAKKKFKRKSKLKNLYR